MNFTLIFKYYWQHYTVKNISKTILKTILEIWFLLKNSYLYKNSLKYHMKFLKICWLKKFNAN